MYCSSAVKRVSARYVELSPVRSASLASTPLATVSRSPPLAPACSRSSRADGAMRSTVSTLIRNIIGAEMCLPSGDAGSLPVYNPATGEIIEEVPLSGAADVDAAARAAAGAFHDWSRTAVMDRVRLMFKFKSILEDRFEELAAIVTRHHVKTLEESRGEVRRGIEVVDFASGAPTLLQGRTR